MERHVLFLANNDRNSHGSVEEQREQVMASGCEYASKVEENFDREAGFAVETMKPVELDLAATQHPLHWLL